MCLLLESLNTDQVDDFDLHFQILCNKGIPLIPLHPIDPLVKDFGPGGSLLFFLTLCLKIRAFTT